MVLKRYKKRAGVKKLLKEAKSKKNLDWDADGQMVLDNRVVPGLNIDNLFQSALKKRNPTLPGVREFESLLCESIVRLLRSEKKRLFLGISSLSKTVVAIARHLYAPQTSEKKVQAKKNDCARRSLSNASRSR